MSYLTLFFGPLIYKKNLDTRVPGSLGSGYLSTCIAKLALQDKYPRKVAKSTSLHLMCFSVTVNKFWIEESRFFLRIIAKEDTSLAITFFEITPKKHEFGLNNKQL